MTPADSSAQLSLRLLRAPAEVEKKPRKRVARTGRSREGCKVCKSRRIKCDESKPSCKNCARSQILCDYDVIRRFVLVEHQPTNMKLHLKPSGTRQERRALDFFFNWTAIELSGPFATDFWQQSVLQLGSTSNALRHAIVAVASIHERFTEGFSLHSSHVNVTDEPKYLFAVRQYNTAIRELYTSLAGPPEILLLCCILFVCFESFRGAPHTAMMHLKNGIQAIQAWKMGELPLGVRMDPTDPTTKAILGLIGRLGPQMTNIDMSDVSQFGSTEADIIKYSGDLFEGLAQVDLQDLSHGFESFEDARDKLNHILNMELSYFFRVNPLYGTPTSERSAELGALLKETITKLDRWVVCFHTLWTSASHNMSDEDSRTALFLQVQYKFTLILINCLFMPSTVGLSAEKTNLLILAWTPQFREVLELVEDLISKQPLHRSGAKKGSSFYPEVGIIAPLFILGLGARDPFVRRRVLELLRGQRRREGTWDSETCCQVLDFIDTHDKDIVYGFLKTRYKLYSDFVFMGNSD